MAPLRTKKCLIPHLFTWTQNFIGILLLLWAAQNDAFLYRLVGEKLDRRMVDVSVGLMLEWLSEMRQSDGIAEWSLRLLEPLYSQIAQSPTV